MRMSPSLAAAACTFALGAGVAQAATLNAVYNTLDGAAPQIIGHRGAPAYLPENSIGGNELAAQMGSDFIETDVMLTSDGVLIAMHDTTLTRTTNVEDIYEQRNGDYLVSDFTYGELQALTLEPTGTGAGTYPGFTPLDGDPYRIPTFAGMLDALTAYNVANGTSVGMLTEGKYADNAETSALVIETLIDRGYDTPAESAVQSFGFGNVASYSELLDLAGVEMGIAQLGGGRLVDDVWNVSDFGAIDVPFATIAGYVDTVALFAGTITEDLIAAAHGEGLSVFGWTFRPADQAAAFDLAMPFLDWGLDGFITDNPDTMRVAIDSFGVQVAAIPLPAGLPMLLGGLAVLGVLRRRRG